MNNNLTEFNTGGSHESNPLGGIPIGVNPNTGAPVTVEEGETKTKIGGRDFIFSNNFKVSKQIIKDYKLPDNLDGLSMSDASKKISEMFSDRADGISKNTISQFYARLSDAQEALKQEKVQQLQETLALNNQYPDESLEGQAPAGIEEYTQQPQQPQEQLQGQLGGLGVQQQMNNGGFFSALFGNQTQEQKDINIANRDARYAAATTRNEKGSDLNTIGNNAINVVSAAPAIMGVIDQAKGNTATNTTQSALSGAMTGLSAGAAFGPIGMGVGAVGGLIAGHIGGNKARKNLINQSNEAAMGYNAQFQEQYAGGGFPVIGNSMLTNNNYGGMRVPKKQMLNPLTKSFMDINSSLQNPDYLQKELPHYAGQNPIMNAQNYLINQGQSLTGGADGKWGPSSQAQLDVWRKKNNINATGPLTPADYESMGYTNMGYTPYSEELDELVIDASKTPEAIADPRIVPEAYQKKQEEDAVEDNPINANQMMRYMTPLGNLLSLNQIQKPTMGNTHQDLTKARRDYIDDQTVARQIREQGNTTGRSIQQSGMTEGARRANMLANSLNTQNAVGNAFIQSQQANRQIDAQADAIDAQTRQSNQRNRMMAEENYQRDLGAYNTERSKLQAQVFTDIGNIGLEGLRADRIGKATGYDTDGNYIKNKATGERYDNTQLNAKITELRKQEGEAKSDFDKEDLARRIAEYEKMRAELILARAPRGTKTDSKPTNNKK